MQRPGRHTAAFTLLEILAVVTMFAVLAAWVVPNVGSVRTRALKQQARNISSQLELARQRSIATGVSHRVRLDLDEHSYQLEWRRASEEPEPAPVAAANPFDDAPLDLAAPRRALAEFSPLPGFLGEPRYLEDNLAFAVVETPGGDIDRGEASVAFETDGSAEYTSIVIDDEDGRAVVLEVLPLADMVRIRDEQPL